MFLFLTALLIAGASLLAAAAEDARKDAAQYKQYCDIIATVPGECVKPGSPEGSMDADHQGLACYLKSTMVVNDTELKLVVPAFADCIVADRIASMACKDADKCSVTMDVTAANAGNRELEISGFLSVGSLTLKAEDVEVEGGVLEATAGSVTVTAKDDFLVKGVTAELKAAKGTVSVAADETIVVHAAKVSGRHVVLAAKTDVQIEGRPAVVSAKDSMWVVALGTLTISVEDVKGTGVGPGLDCDKCTKGALVRAEKLKGDADGKIKFGSATSPVVEAEKSDTWQGTIEPETLTVKTVADGSVSDTAVSAATARASALIANPNGDGSVGAATSLSASVILLMTVAALALL